jgi:hypothetical protein
MPRKHPDSQRIGGPGAAHENRKHPEKSQARGPRPEDTKKAGHSKVSGGGERDSHHTRSPCSRVAAEARVLEQNRERRVARVRPAR